MGAKSPHILTAEERAKPVKINTMYIDIGSTSKEETEQAGVKQGNPVVPSSTFQLCENGSPLWQGHWMTGWGVPGSGTLSGASGCASPGDNLWCNDRPRGGGTAGCHN
ncbi:hypothetical protein [Syntrophaceticus schinkii]|uniref:hypothetical protein n=1 Tax=Syntrophaceticus schinkii TaxID=499207 RepID=UPI0012EBA716